MRTVEISEYGGPEVLQVREAPEPVPGPGEVRVDVSAVEVLFLDTQLRAGWGRDFFPMRPPWVPGTGVAGTIGAVGDGVPADRVGETVVARTGDAGAYAEQVVVPAGAAYGVPDGLDPGVATAALHDGVLALDRLEKADLHAGDRVLITAAAGSLGQWLVPLARAAGAHVVGAAGGPAKVAAVRDLGAEEVRDYRQEGWADGLDPVDVVLDGVGGEVGRTAFAQTRDKGTFFGHGAASGEFAPIDDTRGVRTVGVTEQIDDATVDRLLRQALDLLAAGRVRPTIGQRVPLERAGDAHAAMAARTVVGKTLLVT